MTFRDKLAATLRAIQPVLTEEGVMVVGSEVPNLLEAGAASSLVVSRDVDIGVPVERMESFKRRLLDVRGFGRADDEPSVWLPDAPGLIEVNFLGIDRNIFDPGETYVLDDPDLPLMVFGPLSWLEPGPPVRIEDLIIPVPRPAGLIVEKLATDRGGEKGDRDLLVALGLLLVASEDDLAEMERVFRRLPPELRHAVKSNLTVLSLLNPRNGMPDPGPHRLRVAGVLRRLEKIEP